ncbi:non-homologous end-joining DNA ligase [Jatrophihabitans sp. YIM 134969]
MAEAWFTGLSAADRERVRAEPLPETSAAMLATLTDDRFSDPAWIFERKLDGVRCLARRDADGAVRLTSRNDKDMTATYPEVAVALADACDTDVVVDGEIVAFEGRRTSFERLQGRIGISDPTAALATGIPVFYYVYDVLHLDGRDVRRVPQLARKKLLRAALTWDDPLRFTTHRREAGVEMYEAACRRGDEGVIAKRISAPYTGGRSRDWLKFKCVRDQEFVVGGWTDPKGSRADLGALLVGYHDGDRFAYAGKVGTGFSAKVLADLAADLRPLATDTSPFDTASAVLRRERDVHWVRPELVVQIGFAEWTRDGLLRHPRYQGRRVDKAAADVVRETR